MMAVHLDPRPSLGGTGRHYPVGRGEPGAGLSLGRGTGRGDSAATKPLNSAREPGRSLPENALPSRREMRCWEGSWTPWADRWRWTLEPPSNCGRREIFGPSPPILARTFVNAPLYTGTTIVDTMIPVGRGQRQLIIGGSASGKSSLALDAVISQKESGVLCVYVLIGQKRSKAVAIVENPAGGRGARSHHGNGGPKPSNFPA